MAERETWRFVGRIGKSYWWERVKPSTRLPRECSLRIAELWPGAGSYD